MPRTPVFLCWAEQRAKQLALFLRDWLPNVVPQIAPWMSEEDIGKGSRAATNILETLDRAPIGIIIVTPENIGAPFLNFEAGALAKSAKTRQLACPYLLDITKTQVVGPLTLLQLTDATEEDTRRLVNDINTATDEPLETAQVNRFFNNEWKNLQAKIIELQKATTVKTQPQRRTPEDMLDEVITRVRRVEAQLDRTFPSVSLQPGIVATTGNLSLSPQSQSVFSGALENFVPKLTETQLGALRAASERLKIQSEIDLGKPQSAGVVRAAKQSDKNPPT